MNVLTKDPSKTWEREGAFYSRRDIETYEQITIEPEKGKLATFNAGTKVRVVNCYGRDAFWNGREFVINHFVKDKEYGGYNVALETPNGLLFFGLGKLDVFWESMPARLRAK